MNNRVIAGLVFAAVFVGAIIGVVGSGLNNSGDSSSPSLIADSDRIVTNDRSSATVPAHTAPGIQQTEMRIHALEQKVLSLESRLMTLTEAGEPSDLEPTTQGDRQVAAFVAGTVAGNVAGNSRGRGRSSFLGAPGATTESLIENLVSAGIDRGTADSLVRRQSELELKQLELRDKAAREGYLRTDQFREEMRALRREEVALREEIGTDYYDRFLYQSGQSNRLGVASVISGSAAESAGMRSGDVVVDYDDGPVFEWRDLNTRTTQGERGEYVNLTVLRDGRPVTLSVRRGPLGVRLAPTRVDPDET